VRCNLRHRCWVPAPCGLRRAPSVHTRQGLWSHATLAQAGGGATCWGLLSPCGGASVGTLGSHCPTRAPHSRGVCLWSPCVWVGIPPVGNSPSLGPPPSTTHTCRFGPAFTTHPWWWPRGATPGITTEGGGEILECTHGGIGR